MSIKTKLMLICSMLVLIGIAITVPVIVPAKEVANHNAGMTAQLVRILSEPIASEEEVEMVEAEEYIEIDSTAYWDEFHRKCADGTTPYVGVVAGKREWLGKSVELYDSNMNYMGQYTFHDLGYGQETGWGKSSLLKGMTVGTIEAGLCIDIYMETYSECMRYGRKKIYMKWSN